MDNKSLRIIIFIQILLVSTEFLPSSGQVNPATMVLPDSTIHGTPRHRFEVHDLSDISGGKWKAVHIPDEEITSMLESANLKPGTSVTSDIQHEHPKATAAPKLDGNSTLGHVHNIEHLVATNTTRSTSVGNLIVAMENEVRGKETKPLHSNKNTVIKLRKKAKEEEPSTRGVLRKVTQPSRHPALLVAKIPDDDDTSDGDDDLPLDRSEPKPIVASLRKSAPKVGEGAMRSMIHKRGRLFGKESTGAWLNQILAQVRMPTVAASLRHSFSLTGQSHGNTRKEIQPSSDSEENVESKSQQTAEQVRKTKLPQKKDSESNVVKKIKELLLKSRKKPEGASSIKQATKIPKQKADDVSETGANPVPSVLKSLFDSEPPKQTDGPNAFTNHAAVLNRISSEKKEALLVGIIKALLSRGRPNNAQSSRASAMTNMPHFNRQDVLQGVQSNQMLKTENGRQNNVQQSGINPEGPNSVKSLEDFDIKQRNEEIKEELARANEESMEARRMRTQEGNILSNYDRFQNPEDRLRWKGVMNQENSQTGEGQSVSVLGPQQISIVAENPTST